MRFTDELRAGIAPIYESILAHPFLQELTDGSLSRESFVFYMKQDALYLQDFSRALAIAGARSTNADDMQAFYSFASSVIVVERALHEGYFKEFGATLEVEPAPACFAYTQFLIATASAGSYAEAVAALLPCFWIYRDVGNDIYRRAEGGLASNPYARWIETYAGEDFDASVTRAIAITESVAQSASAEDRACMVRAFERSARLEWMFWDSAYRLEAWPPRASSETA
jgi:thiaminase (transcriptional activator TenA)